MIILAIVQVVFCLFLIGAILLQPSKHTGISGSISGAADSFFSKNKSKSMEGILSKLTTVVAVLFVITTLVLNML